MAFDINNVVTEMISVIKDSADAKWKQVKGTANTYIESRKERLDELAWMRINNQIDEDFFERRLNDEKRILESELLSLRIISLAIAQKTANAALDVLSKSVKAALKF